MMEILSYFAFTKNTLIEVQQVAKLRDCIASTQSLNSTTQSEILAYSEIVDWTMQQLPISFVKAVSYVYESVSIVVWLNVMEAFMYLSIFRYMKRYYFS